jgi:hypothetical protein
MMIKLSLSAALAILGVLMCSHAYAQTRPMLAKSTRDLSLEISPDFEGVTGDTLDEIPQSAPPVWFHDRLPRHPAPYNTRTGGQAALHLPLYAYLA